MINGETFPGMAAPRISQTTTAIGDLGQPTWNPSGPLPPGLTLMWSDHDTLPQVFTHGPEGAIVQAPRSAINPRTKFTWLS